MTPLRAVVVGATGAVGGALVRSLCASPRFSQVVALARRSVTTFTGIDGSAKLRLEVIDLGDLEKRTAALAEGCDAAFNTMGVGQTRKVSFEEFVRVDVTYAGAFARGAATAGVRHISLLSSVGAGRPGRYLQVKGDAERVIAESGIARVSIFRPSLLMTREARYGLQDRLLQTFFPLVSPLMPSRFHQIRVEQVAQAMRVNAEREGPPGRTIFHYREMTALLG